MYEDGIDLELAVSSPVLDKALEDAVKDLEGIADKRYDAKSELEDIEKNPETGKIQYGQVFDKDRPGKFIAPFPIIDFQSLFIGRKEISPYGGDYCIKIDSRFRKSGFEVPESVIFSEEMMKEYEMKDEGAAFGRRRLRCPNCWRPHNVGPINRILYKNLIIAIDNEVVKRKYSK
jgi:hypothetical protein